MLFLATRVLDHHVNEEGRLRLLERLQERKITPLIRSTRLNCYEQALSDSERVGEMESAIARAAALEGQAPYLQGDVFCFDDHVFFLLFEDSKGSFHGMRAGIVYEPQTEEPLKKLDSFCQAISLSLEDAGGRSGQSKEAGIARLTAWHHDRHSLNPGFMRFVAKQDVDTLSSIVCKENSIERIRAAELLEDDYARCFLRRAKEAYAEGYPLKPSDDGTNAPPDYLLGKLVEVGLLRREVLVSCRKTGHILFSLPSSDALAVVTISNAKCSECATEIADEKIEEVLAPTRLSSIMLEDGAWLVNRLHTALREIGIPESEIVIEPPAGDGEARVMARVCGEPILLVMRDGELTPAFARRAINTKLETDARHLVIVVTGVVHNEGRTALLNFANRMTRGGNDFELTIAEGAMAAASELMYVSERISQRVIAEQLCELDASIGLSLVRLITTRFQILRSSKRDAAPRTQLPAPAAAESIQSLQNTPHAVSLIGDNRPQ